MFRLNKSRMARFGLVLLLVSLLVGTFPGISLAAGYVALGKNNDASYNVAPSQGNNTSETQAEFEATKSRIDPIIDAALQSSGDVRNDLLKRGLLVEERDARGEIKGGEVWFNKIEDLIKSGVYHIDQAGALQAGASPTDMGALTTTYYYKWAQQRCTRLNYWDEYIYRGLQYKVPIPASITENPKTAHVLYCGHLFLTGNRWIEGGVGWRRVDGYTFTLIIYTETTYEGNYHYFTIPSGYSRDVLIKLEILNGTTTGAMLVYDTGSGTSIYNTYPVPATDHCANFQQEECSTYSSGGWTTTPQVKNYDSILKNTSNNWINWNNNVSTKWSADSPPMYQNHGIENDRKWMTTWCTP